MCVKLNLLFDSEINVYYVTYVLKQCITARCPYYILAFRNTNSYGSVSGPPLI